MIYSFSNDYAEGCHPDILKALAETNDIQQPGYGDDEYSRNVVQIVRELTKSDADVHLIAGGTLTNLTVLASIMRPFESVVSACTGHIFTNEAGAIEATGHKVEAALTEDGKLRPANIAPFLNKPRGHHSVRTRVVYISNSTEVGTIYTKKELIALSEFCRVNDLILFMDGARLPMALTAHSNNMTLADVAALTDIFYIGGTKCGALLGEAVVITNPLLKKDFKYFLKQHGALTAKGRVMGIQFDRLLRDNLIFDLAAHANRMAAIMSKALIAKGYPMWIASETNQIFPILPNEVADKMQRDYGCLEWKVIGSEHKVMRFITSWATPEKVVKQFAEDLKGY